MVHAPGTFILRALAVAAALCAALRIDKQKLPKADHTSAACECADCICDLKKKTTTDEDRSLPMVAVLEHTMEWGHDGPSTLRKNLDIYAQEAATAALSGVKLLVFPEYGLSGYVGSSRSEWYSYSEDIPEVSDQPWSPCDWPGFAENWYAVRRLSCLAKENNMTIVANLVDFKNCESNYTSHPDCVHSSDGRLLFNTNVVFDSDGTFLSKYHKTNKWGEHAIDVPSRCEAPTFTPKALGVTFGMFICADLIHSYPALDLVSTGIRHFVMPLAWSNEMAAFQPLSWLQSWSLVTNATLLAANVRELGFSGGSGIFSRGKVVQQVHGVNCKEKRKLLIAPLPHINAVSEAPRPCPPQRKRSLRTKRSKDGKWKTERLDMSRGRHRARVCRRKAGTSKPVCCQLRYESIRSPQPGFGFVLAVLNGEDKAPGILPWTAQACAVLACEEGTDCMEYDNTALAEGPTVFGGFSYLQIQANFSSSALVYPHVMVGNDHLVPPDEFNFDEGARKLTFQGTKANQLVSMQLYGRLFSEDRKSHSCICGIGHSAGPKWKPLAPTFSGNGSLVELGLQHGNLVHKENSAGHKSRRARRMNNRPSLEVTGLMPKSIIRNGPTRPGAICKLEKTKR